MVSGGRSARDREREEAVRGFEKAMEESRDAFEAGSNSYTLEEIADNWIKLLGGVAMRQGWIARNGTIVKLKSEANKDSISEAVHFHSEGDAESFHDWVLGKLRLENADFEYLRRI